MSSNIARIDFRTRDIRILRKMLKQANYVTAKLKPLAGPLNHPSQSVLRRFMTGTMQEPAK
ncbi:hypothetical protein IB238_04035 [Rhizobium sp. ARZ01]|uniref:hypothetical protein n=1 Tax=Rhizobium sp. ARZ01 TaxID=2769313 RepID=UPI00178349CB|nr:hypothetical protein [Rhizobium sp. ARZ01]MBD9371810.1 hypothetical protein [Rhizobium sp. ARZ01]